MTLDEFHDLYAYNRWVNGWLLAAVDQLDAAAFTRDLGSSVPSVRGTPVHGEIVTMLRQPGATPVSTDLIRWYREGRPA